ncbi:MAG: hypothetical protein ACRYG8_53220 [Janthinobacterium lividum]
MKIAAATAEAKFETSKLEAVTKWRKLSSDTIAALRRSPNQATTKIHISYLTSDAETFYYAFQLSKVFESVGYSVTSDAVQLGNGVSVGFFVPASTVVQEGVIHMRQTLTAAKLEFLTEAPFKPSASYGVHPQPDEVLIFVSLRPDLIKSVLERPSPA